MTYREKKDSYESLMSSIAPDIEKAISEYYSEDTVMFAKNFMSINNQLIKIKERLNQKIENLSQEEIDDMCLNCLNYAHAIHSISSQRILDGTFKNSEEFKESFENLKKRLGTAFGLVDWQVDINNVFHNGNALARTYYKIDKKPASVPVVKTGSSLVTTDSTSISFMGHADFFFAIFYLSSLKQLYCLRRMFLSIFKFPDNYTHLYLFHIFSPNKI